jgi:glycerol-3-phosphate cytidylyltransferase
MKKIGFIASCFDMGPHAGHAEFIKFAKLNCDYLICGLHVNPQLERPEKNKPLYPLHERFIILSQNKFIDEILPYETEADLIKILLLKNVNVRILGSDYKDKFFTGRLAHIETVYFERNHDVSSSAIRKIISK